MTADEANRVLAAVDAALRNGAAPLSLAVSCTVDGRDALPDAWAAGTNDWVMFRVALPFVDPDTLQDLNAFCDHCELSARHFVKRHSDTLCPGCVAMIRRAVPTITITDVLRAARRAA